ncbi:B3 domain-containing protein REM5-like [Solanum dulcamara]|uniref:B3 domain-containing protein REM5-like n=1 Tax=Solanum dulcamara TaxID=45834 RepID=UPI002484E2E2|nr:B3 domain-containing protein REM5-like [Solanum dulcamara]
MEIPPKKPHFFKPILPGFKNGLKIPIGFLKYLKGHDHIEHATLRRAGKKWLVKANGRRLEEGSWKEFVEELNLELGDILLFKHEGKMEFEVSIFDSSHCDREYDENEDEDEDEDEEGDEDKDKDENEDEDDEDENEEEQEDVDKEGEEAATHDKPLGQFQFECIIRQYCLSRGFLVSLKTHFTQFLQEFSCSMNLFFICFLYLC